MNNFGVQAQKRAKPSTICIFQKATALACTFKNCGPILTKLPFFSRNTTLAATFFVTQCILPPPFRIFKIPSRRADFDHKKKQKQSPNLGQIRIKNTLKEKSICIQISNEKLWPRGEPKYRKTKKPLEEPHFAYEVENTSIFKFIICTMLFLEGFFSCSVFGLSFGREFTFQVFQAKTPR